MTANIKHFLSLKWKALLLLSIVLFLSNGALAVLFYLSTIDHLEQQQNKNLAQQTRELKSLLFADKAQLQSFAEILSIVLPSSSNEYSVADNLSLLLKNNGALINASWGIEQLVYYSPKGEILFRWSEQKGAEDTKKFALNVIANEKPDSFFLCFSDRCEHVVAIPVLDVNQQVNSLLLSRSLADVLFNFVELTKADITLVKSSHTQEKSNNITDGILLSSHKPEIINLFNELTKSQSALLREQGKLRIKYEDDWFEIYEFSALKGHEDVYFIITNRVTGLMDNIENTVFNSFLVGFLGFLLSEISLLLFLRYPLIRLQRVTTSLPLLAEGKFLKFRNALKQQKIQRLAADEIDLVEDIILNTSVQLENYQIEKQQQALVLKYERDFVTKLIEDAPVIILSQTLDNVVTQINQQGLDIFHKQEEDILGTNFFQTLVSPDVSEVEISNFKLWGDSGVGVYQHEIKMPSYDEETKVIHWTHSKHHYTENNETLILSIGLDLSDRIKAEENLSWLALHDSLTELPNRRYFEKSFKATLNQHIRYKHSGILLFFDLDQFKYVNDVSGHHSGDELLKLVASNILKLLRTNDVFARLGGDEFAIILPETDEAESISVANKILQTLNNTSLSVDGYKHKVSASIGITLFPKHGKDINTLMAHADIAMYQAKYAGRGRWYLYSDKDMAQELLSNKAYWREKIDNALMHKKFIFHFQPILNLKENKINHYEALIRMVGEEGELIYPDSFIPVAEQTGQIQAIDYWVVNHALDILLENSEISLAINLSSSAITNQNLVSLIKRLLLKNNRVSKRIIFEITETAAVENLTSAVLIMNELRALGCQFALDDFGTGFSSFSYLKQLPADIIKIDGAFVKDIDTSKEDQLFVKAINDVSIGLSKKTVAEYVESEAIFTVLKDMGVDYVQGYFIGKPQDKFL